MTKKLMMSVGTAIRNLALLVSFAVAFGAWAATETVGGYTWTYQINGDTAENYGIILAIRKGEDRVMATLSMFFGIIIKMYKERDGRHHRPHIHAQHADKAAS